MEIQINNDEINIAIKEYVVSQGIDISESDVRVEFVAGRKKGNSACVTIAPKGTLPPIEEPEAKKKPKAKASALAEPEPEEPEVATGTAEGEKLNLFGDDPTK